MVNDRWLSRSLACAMAFVVLLVTGCAQSPSDREAPNPDFPSRAGADTGGGESAALGLVNLWRVSGVAEEQVNTWLRFDAGEFQLWRDCGMIHGAWQATETRFLASVYGASGDCVVDGTVPRAEWLDAVTGYRAAGAGWELTDVSDAVVASLAVDGAPEPIPTAATFYAEPPVITDSTRQLMRKPVPLPPELSPVMVAELAGKWIPVGDSASTDPHVVFGDDGTWSGSDGCNSAQGRWAVDATGAFLATAGVMTQIGCEGAPVPTWVASARSAGLDGALLLLLDVDGSEIVRLRAHGHAQERVNP